MTIPRSQAEELRRAALAAARAGGALLRDRFAGRSELVIERKSKNDFVSAADRDAESEIVRVLEEQLGPTRVLGEEHGLQGSDPDSELEWIIDPLDGTTNFLEGLPIWCVSVAGLVRGRRAVGVVYEPLRGRAFAAALGLGCEQLDDDGARQRLCVTDKAPEDAFLSTGFPFRAHEALDDFLAVFRQAILGCRAVRRCGAAALDLAHVAAGVYDGFFEFRLSPWDVAAGGLLIEEAGGIVTDLDGGDDWMSSGNIVAGNPAVQAQLLGWCRSVTSQARLDELVPLPD